MYNREQTKIWEVFPRSESLGEPANARRDRRMPADCQICRRQVIQMKKILLVTSAYTGAGHKSISDALSEQFAKLPDVQVEVIDGFELMGEIGVQSSKLYGFVTRRARAVWKMAWHFTMAQKPRFTTMAHLGNRRFTDYIRKYHPDLILTVHPMFNATLTRILEFHGLHIPVVVLQADLINIHRAWCNPQATMTICPTREAYDCSVRLGMRPDQLVVLGFPTRERFCSAARAAHIPDYDGSRPLRCLMMSGGEGSGNLRAYADAILDNTNASLTIICGRNKKLRKQLRASLGSRYGERINVLGFVTEVEQEMLKSDLIIARGSPNSMLEAVIMNVPLVITGALPGQERDNPLLMQNNNLGVISEDPDDMPLVLRDLLYNGGARLKEIRAAQREYRNFDNARTIAEYVANMTAPLEYTI